MPRYVEQILGHCASGRNFIKIIIFSCLYLLRVSVVVIRFMHAIPSWVLWLSNMFYYFYLIFPNIHLIFSFLALFFLLLLNNNNSAFVKKNHWLYELKKY